jgi:hypothetical protein
MVTKLFHVVNYLIWVWGGKIAILWTSAVRRDQAGGPFVSRSRAAWSRKPKLGIKNDLHRGFFSRSIYIYIYI